MCDGQEEVNNQVAKKITNEKKKRKKKEGGRDVTEHALDATVEQIAKRPSS